MNPNVEIELAGRYRMIVTRPDGTQRDSGWFDNLITEIGLNRIGSGGVGEFIAVGSGSAAPTFADTSLQALVATSTNVQRNESGAQAASPYYGWYRRTVRFAAGQAAGNLSEVGLGWSGSAEARPVFSRALIRDANGDPTTITVLGDEVLDVLYEMRLYPPMVDQEFNITVSGVVYACVMRASTVTSGSWSPWNLFDSGSQLPYNITAFQGPLGTILEGPSGQTGGTPTANPKPYANNSLKRGYSASWGLDTGNVPGGIGVFQLSPWSQGNLGLWQVSVTPKIQKDNTKILSMDFDLSWTRKT